VTFDSSQHETPASWDHRKIKFHLAGFFGGGTPSKDNLDYWTDGTVPWVTPKDMKRHMIDMAEDLITVDAVKKSATNMVPPCSVLMVVRSGILKHSLPVALNTVPVALNQDMKAFRFRRSLLPEFFAYWIEGQQKQKLLEWCQIGATVENIDVDAMLNAQIAVPDLATQRQIADFLDRETARIDLLIEKKQRLVALLGEKVRSEIHDLFHSLDAKTWRIRHLGKVKNGAGFPIDLQGDSSNEIPFFKVKHLAVNGLDQRITESEDTITKYTARTLRATGFPAGTIVFAKIGAALLLCRFSIIGTGGCIDNNLAAFVVNKYIVDSDYLLLCFERFEMQLMVQPGAVPSLSTEKFIHKSVPLPPLEGQRELVEQVRRAVQRNGRIVRRTKDSIDRLREYRSALITAAVTGQIDVQTYAKSGTPDRRLNAIQEEMGA